MTGDKRWDSTPEVEPVSGTRTDGGTENKEGGHENGMLGAYAHLVEQAEDGLYLLDSSGTFTLVNDAFIELTEYDRTELVGADPTLVLEEDDFTDFNRKIQAVLRSDSSSGSILTTVVTKSGQHKPVEVRFSLMRTEDGEYDGLAGVARDIRARRHREQKLDVLSRVLRHNVRNKLNLIFGHAAILKESDDEQYQRAAEQIEDAATELMSLSEKARTAQTEVGFNPSDDYQTDLVELTEHLAVKFRREYPQARIKTNLPEEVVADVPESYRIAVSELIENAIEHNPDSDPLVRIRVTTTETTVRTVIEDECPPIRESDIEAINQGEETPLVHSVGIGLWLANWVSDTVGGELQLGRREDGTGNQATIILYDNQL